MEEWKAKQKKGRQQGSQAVPEGHTCQAHTLSHTLVKAPPCLISAEHTCLYPITPQSNVRPRPYWTKYQHILIKVEKLTPLLYPQQLKYIFGNIWNGGEFFFFKIDVFTHLELVSLEPQPTWWSWTGQYITYVMRLPAVLSLNKLTKWIARTDYCEDIMEISSFYANKKSQIALINIS